MKRRAVEVFVDNYLQWVQLESSGLMETTKLSISCWFFCFLWEIKSVVIPTTRICSLGDQTGCYQLLDDYSTPVHYTIFSWQGSYFVEQLLWNEFRFWGSLVCCLAVLSITSCPILQTSWRPSWNSSRWAVLFWSTWDDTGLSDGVS